MKLVVAFCNENDLKLYLEQTNVSVKRTEETATKTTITYRCSNYRKYPECDFQIKSISNSDAEIIVLSSNTHNHEHRATTTRAPLPVRDIVMNADVAGLSLGQTRRAVQNQYKGLVASSQLTSLLNYHRSLTVPDVYPIHNFRLWCYQHSAILSDPSKFENLGKRRRRPKKAKSALSR